jgi:predicted DNA-binding WGR domain protein
MKIFFYMGTNPRTVERVSWKIWQIERQGRKVTTYWGPAKLVKRRPIPASALRETTRTFASPEAARSFEAQRIHKKLAKGYERRPRARS